MKEYSIYINKSLPDGGFDVCLNKTLTECDITVYSIPFRESLKITEDGILIKQLLGDLLAYKAFYPEDVDIIISSNISGFLKNSSASLSSNMLIESDACFSANKVLPDINHKLHIDSAVDFIIQSMTEASSQIEIGANNIEFILSKYFQMDESLQINSDISSISLNKNVSGKTSMQLESSAAIFYWLLLEPDPLEISIRSSVGLSEIRYRLLYEIDDYTLSEIDNFSLEDLDFVVLG